MKIIFCLIFTPLFCYSQEDFYKISLLSGKVEIQVPKALTNMTDEKWQSKNGNTDRPILILSDTTGEINLIAELTQQIYSEEKLDSYKSLKIGELLKTKSGIRILKDVSYLVKKSWVGYIKFSNTVFNQKMFNFYFFTIVDGKILLFRFNCSAQLEFDWNERVEKILRSIKVK